MKHEPAVPFQNAIDGGSPRPGLLARAVPVHWLAGGLVAYLGASQLLLWRFLDVVPAAAYVLGVVAVSALSWGVAMSIRKEADAANPSLGTLLVCVAAAFALFILGGEGRLFYANIDWQVRDAVLRDMAINPWPFAYTARGELDVLRAPLGMYFVPALAFKALGAAAGDWAMLVQNSLLLGALLVLASTLLSTTRARLGALAVFIAFSGLDIVGAAATQRMSEHLDAWAGVEFSANLALAFWVPHHALAGWAGALFYLLWEKWRQPLRPLLTIVPLTALWSPLAMMGCLPFVAAAAGSKLARGRLRPADVLLPALSALLCLPGLFYLTAASDAVGSGQSDVTTPQYLFFQAVETLPYLVPLAFVAVARREHRLTLAIAAACLLVAPVVRIGASVDFASRVSIPALAVIAFLTAEALSAPRGMVRGSIKFWLLLVLGVGAVTGAFEVARAVSHPPSPRGTCTFFKAWDESFAKYPKDTYVAPLDRMPRLLRPRSPALVPSAEPQRCWPGTWYHPI